MYMYKHVLTVYVEVYAPVMLYGTTMYTSMHTCICTYICIHFRMCVYVYIHIHTCIHLHVSIYPIHAHRKRRNLKAMGPLISTPEHPGLLHHALGGHRLLPTRAGILEARTGEAWNGNPMMPTRGTSGLEMYSFRLGAGKAWEFRG